jgi:hypothetical protein
LLARAAFWAFCFSDSAIAQGTEQACCIDLAGVNVFPQSRLRHFLGFKLARII